MFYIYFFLYPYGLLSEIKDLLLFIISPTHDIIKSVTTVRDLGVTMSNSCDFNAHIHDIDKTVKTCSRLVSWILRIFTTHASTTMLTLF